MFFLRKATRDADPLVIRMTGIRMGERLLQIGADDPKSTAIMASKVGLSGTAVVVVGDEESATATARSASRAGALVDVRVTSLASLPFEGNAFDVVVVNGTRGLLRALEPDTRLSALREAHRVLRRGGRIIAIEAGPRDGLRGLLRPYQEDSAYAAGGGSLAAVRSAGFNPARLLWEREGYRFIEGLKS